VATRMVYTSAAPNEVQLLSWDDAMSHRGRSLNSPPPLRPSRAGGRASLRAPSMGGWRPGLRALRCCIATGWPSLGGLARGSCLQGWSRQVDVRRDLSIGRLDYYECHVVVPNAPYFMLFLLAFLSNDCSWASPFLILSPFAPAASAPSFFSFLSFTSDTRSGESTLLS